MVKRKQVKQVAVPKSTRRQIVPTVLGLDKLPGEVLVLSPVNKKEFMRSWENNR